MMFKCLALVSLASALAAAPVDDLLAKARRALANDGVLTAWKLAQEALGQAPDSAAAHEFSGEVLFRRGEFQQADVAFQAALQHDPTYALAWWGRARIAKCSSMRKSAAEYIRRAHDLNPRDLRIFAEWIAGLPGDQRIDALEQYGSHIDPGRNPGEYSDLIERIRLERLALGRKFSVLTSPYQSTEIPLGTYVSNTTHMRTYVLDMEVNGAALRLVVDTGSTGIIISRKAGAKTGIKPLVSTTVSGLGDSTRLPSAYQGVAGRVRVGAVEFHDTLVRVSDQDSVADSDGLIGTDLFSDFLVTLDFPGRKLRLDPLPGYEPRSQELRDRANDPAFKSFTPVYRFGHLLLVPTRVSGSRPALFVIDSGAAKNLISSELAKELTAVTPDAHSRMTGLSGTVANLYQTGDLEPRIRGLSSEKSWNDGAQLVGSEPAHGNRGFRAVGPAAARVVHADYRLSRRLSELR